jgi:hypothetical protein
LKQDSRLDVAEHAGQLLALSVTHEQENAAQSSAHLVAFFDGTFQAELGENEFPVAIIEDDVEYTAYAAVRVAVFVLAHQWEDFRDGRFAQS